MGGTPVEYSEPEGTCLHELRAVSRAVEEAATGWAMRARMLAVCDILGFARLVRE